MTTYYVDIPTENCIAQPDGAFKNVAQFTTPQEAVKFCQEHFAADERGYVSLISPAIGTRRQQMLTYAALVYARANIDDFNNAFAADKGIEVEGEWMESATEADFTPSVQTIENAVRPSIAIKKRSLDCSCDDGDCQTCFPK